MVCHNVTSQNNHHEVKIMKIPIRFYYDQGASTAPLLCFCHFYCDSGPFDKILEA